MKARIPIRSILVTGISFLSQLTPKTKLYFMPTVNALCGCASLVKTNIRSLESSHDTMLSYYNQKRIQVPVKNLWWSVLLRKAIGKLQAIFVKRSIVDIWKDSKYASDNLNLSLYIQYLPSRKFAVFHQIKFKFSILESCFIVHSIQTMLHWRRLWKLPMYEILAEKILLCIKKLLIAKSFVQKFYNCRSSHQSCSMTKKVL